MYKLYKKPQKLNVSKVVRFTKKGRESLTYKKVKKTRRVPSIKRMVRLPLKRALRKESIK